MHWTNSHKVILKYDKGRIPLKREILVNHVFDPLTNLIIYNPTYIIFK